MITLLSEIHFWTTLEDVVIKHTDCGTFKYYNKKDVDDSIYAQSKKQYCQQRGVIWTPLNKRPQKLRDRLKELEEYLVHNRVVYLSLDENRLKLLLSTGLLITVTISKTGDLTNIVFDKQLSTKLQVNIICDGTLLGNQVICICNDGHVFGFGGPWKEGWVLEGGPRRRLNYYGEWLAVWGKASAEHPQPWSPLAKDHQRANLHLYWIGSGDPELLAYKKTDGEPLQVVVSKTSSRTLIVVEQRVTQRGAVSVEVSNLELVGNILKRVSVTSVPLQTQVSCTALSDSEDRLLICCIDGALALLDRKRGSTRTVKAAFIPTLAAWHPDGAIVAVSNERGQLQYYDTALSCIKSQLVGEDCTPTAIIDFSSYINVQFSIASVSWGPKDLIFSLEQGPLVLVRHVGKPMTFQHLMQRYLIQNKVDKAIKLLLSWEFNEASFFGLQRIVTHLMRMPLTEDVAQHLQNALGSFHNSPVPLRSQIRHRYGNQVISLTRRFFHQLVRAEMFETAFLLAVDVAHHDLFMDLHYVAVRIGETEMAAAARAQASALLSQYSSEASDCSRSSCSQCSDTDSSSSVEYDTSTNKTDEPKATVSKSGFVRQPDNCLTTDFNQSQPTTYKAPSQNGDYHRPRATFVKSPQVPSDFIRKSSTVMTPPLPFTPPLPNLSSTSLGIPYLSGNHLKPSPTYQYSPVSSTTYGSNIFSSSNMSGGIFMSNSNNSKLLQNSVAYTAFSSSNLRVDNAKKTYATINKVQAPPLPNVSLETVTDNTATSTAKKHQPKVKFSDTVTAFIVPEIKRPQRPPPPSHVTNPQKELADSLPLCHPNEDYLKDFAPVRRDDSNEESDNGQPPKIKVVHFGVV